MKLIEHQKNDRFCKKGGGLEKLSCPQVPVLQDSKTFIAQGLILISLALKKIVLQHQS